MLKEELKTAVLEYNEQKILKITFKKNVTINLDIAKELNEASKALTNNDVHVNLIDARQRPHISSESRSFLASENQVNVIAIAILVNSTIQERMGNFQINRNKPKIKTKIFSKETVALKWLTTHLTKAI